MRTLHPARWLWIALLAAAPRPVGAGSATPAEMAGGVAWLDCDNDGDLDLLSLDPSGEIRLLAYDPARGTFDDVSETGLPAPIRNLDLPPQGVACGDLNNDGAVDLFISMEGPNLLLLGDGTGRFTPVARAAGISGEALSTSVALFDYDADGRLDIYVANYMGMPNRLYHNLGWSEDGIPRFADVAPELGVAVAANGQSDWSLGVAVADYDNDGDVDLYVANDYNGMKETGPGLNEGDNILYRNEGDGTFRDVTYAAGAGDPGWAMGVAFGDYDNDGWLDLFVANFWEDALLRNNGDGTFTNVTREAGLITDAPGEWHYNGWGTSFFDYDNDGDLDLHVANGFILNDQGQVLNEPNQLWENQGPDSRGRYRFREVGEAAGVADIGGARGAAYADFNGDGFVDMAVVNNGWLAGGDVIQAPRRMLYVNQGDGTFAERGRAYGFRDEVPDPPRPPARGEFRDNAWLRVEPRVGVPGRGAWGARMVVEAGGRRWLRHLGAGSYCSQNAPVIHVGLGTASFLERVTVRFPSGRVVTLHDVAPNQTIRLDEPRFTPVRLLEFQARSEPDAVDLSWRLADADPGTRVRVVETTSARLVVEEPAAAAGHARDPVAGTGRLRYRMTAVERDGSTRYLGEVGIVHRPVAAAYPNPFADRVSLPAPTGVRLGIFTVSGRLLRILPPASPGNRAVWDGRDAQGRRLPDGTYFYRPLGASGPEGRLVLRR